MEHSLPIVREPSACWQTVAVRSRARHEGPQFYVTFRGFTTLGRFGTYNRIARRIRWLLVSHWPHRQRKTAVGIALAQRLGAEIISLDSMAVYRGLDIGTAKPSVAERARVPDHLIDLCEPDDEFSVAQYVEAAARAVEAIRARGKQVLFVGGTPMYLKALLRGLFSGPPADWELRSRLLAEAQERGPRVLHQRLERVDPRAAARLHENDTRRIVRALEVIQLTGRSIVDWQTHWDDPPQAAAADSANSSRVFVLDWPREVLYARINTRVQAMFDAGLIDEVRRLLVSERGIGRTARQALGYREVLEHLAGQHDLPTTIELVARRTRNFAKRQLTWFRSLSECRWVEMKEPLEAEAVAASIIEKRTSTR